MKDFECLKLVHSKPVRIVCRARCKLSGRLVVLKVYNKRELSHSECGVHLSEAQVRREIELHGRLKHPGVCELYAAFEDSRTIVLVLEHCQVSLAEQLESRGAFPERRAKKLLRELYSALSYVHSCGVLHRDISPGNILFSEDGSMKIADFGLAIDVANGRPADVAGTIYYCAPEVLRPLVDPDSPNIDYGLKSDVWSCGVIAYEMLTGFPLFDEDPDLKTTKQKIVAGVLQVRQGVTADQELLLWSALQVDPAARLSMQELANHPWLSDSPGNGSVLRCATGLTQSLSGIPEATEA